MWRLACGLVLAGSVLFAQGPVPSWVSPRPVDAKRRSDLGFPPPRKPDAIILLLDALEKQYIEFGTDPTQYRGISRHDEALRRQRIDLVSELEEAGYAGDRLPEFLETKLHEMRLFWSPRSSLSGEWATLRADVIRLHPGSPAAARAAADALYDVVLMLDRHDLQLDEASFEKVARAEAARSDAEAGHVLLDALRKAAPETKERWYDWIVRNMRDTSLGYRFVMRKRTFGKPIRLQGVDFDGNEIDTHKWKGDVILVEFWGTWCVPCKEAMPEIAAVHSKLKSRGLRVVGVLSDFKVDEARKWLEQRGYDWPQFVDRSLTERTLDQHFIAKRYAIGGFPTLWVIDRAGVLREEGERGELQAQVEKFLAEPAPK
jgi:thiol-disulfide isomerase/thioredoxin